MDDFGVYAVFGVNGPPQRLLSADGSCRVSVAVPPSVRQVVLFSSGPWGERICVNAELNDAERIPITIGKLTPYNKCLSWEQWEEETWTDSVTLKITLEGGNLVKADWSEPELILAVTEYTPKDTVAPLAARELNGKRKRGRMSEEGGDENKAAKRGEEENVCPNGSVEKTTPVRKARGQTKGAQKLFSSGGDAAKMKGTANGTGETLGIVGRTPPQSAAKLKSRQGKTPTQSAPLGQPVRSLGSDSVSHRCSDSYSDWRTGSQDAVLQRSHVEALHRGHVLGCSRDFGRGSNT
ncbi:hypothetical protein E3U43_007853 [Larimichthys crocea]|uniref:Uncharacterized protein n=1 Tax=Larimichthys crocea TaxID=215358 RepID=A0ACD3Q556_LARCR|nr:hypothetical protein E3U43_007853 [Larimichthys crocea]